MTLRLKRVLPAVRAAGYSDENPPSDEQVQTLVYLFERAGAQLGYRYTWDVGGPFSESLAELWRSVRRRQVALEDVQVDDARDDTLDRAGEMVNQLREHKPETVVDLSSWLRLLTCVDFLERRSGVPLGNGSTPQFLERRYGRTAIDSARVTIQEVLPPKTEPLALP